MKRIFCALAAVLFFSQAVISAESIEKSPVALVLGGGGARGAYQIGVWKGLRELGIEIGCVYGVSVGAINGAVILMDDYDTAVDLWCSVEKSDVMELSDAGERVITGKFSLDDLAKTALRLIENRGIGVSPLAELINSRIDESEIRASGKDFGLVTYSISDFSEKSFYLSEIPRGELVDYILASANFPLFQRQVIDGKEYIDGGISRNLALGMVDPRKYSEAVVVSLDLYSVHDIIDYYRDYSSYDFNVRFISPRFDAGPLLDFSPEHAERLMKMGYLDCLSACGRLYGEKYYIDGGEGLFRELFLRLSAEERRTAAELLELKDIPEPEYFKDDSCFGRLILPELYRYADDDIAVLERAAHRLGIEKEELYTAAELLGEIVEKYIGREHNSIYYNRHLDFISYLYLEE